MNDSNYDGLIYIKTNCIQDQKWIILLLFGLITCDIYSIIKLYCSHAFSNFINTFNLGLNKNDLQLIKKLRFYNVLCIEKIPMLLILFVFLFETGILSSIIFNEMDGLQ